MFRVIKSAGLVVAASAALIGGAASAASANADAEGYASHSPGVLSGNVVQVPIHVPINVCGNSVNIVGALNPTFGNVCVNGDGHDKHDNGHLGKDYRG
ncbi:chaplin [Streptomyces sp. NA04227]|uniref:chaplin n=1 Tax=Streptomyces sp. NA04227 TaxID=2742136 RepID=UPI001591FE58|nr:chaplin [Streptomyces sp. NA04227]QKW10462.1 chaplin [Streptomyces sp. NA04227]